MEMEFGTIYFRANIILRAQFCPKTQYNSMSSNFLCLLMTSGIFTRCLKFTGSLQSTETVQCGVVSEAIETEEKGNASTTFIKEFIELFISTAGYKERKQPLEINIKSSSL